VESRFCNNIIKRSYVDVPSLYDTCLKCTISSCFNNSYNDRKLNKTHMGRLLHILCLSMLLCPANIPCPLDPFRTPPDW
jgi:hypothetical protein